MYKNSSWNFFSELGVKDPNSKYKGDIDLISRCPWQGYTFVTFRLYCKTRPSTQTFKNGNFLKGHKTRSMKWFSLFVISRILWLVQNAILRSIYRYTMNIRRSSNVKDKLMNNNGSGTIKKWSSSSDPKKHYTLYSLIIKWPISLVDIVLRGSADSLLEKLKVYKNSHLSVICM